LYFYLRIVIAIMLPSDRLLVPPLSVRVKHKTIDGILDKLWLKQTRSYCLVCRSILANDRL